MADVTITVGTPSGEYQHMQVAWRLISDILSGAQAIRAAGTLYLPKYEDEFPAEYDRRRRTASWRPEFADSLRTLSAKPFEKEVGLRGDVSVQVKAIAEDVDARGNSQTTFAKEVFTKGIAKGFHAILVDFPSMNPGATVAEERAAGARPNWIHVQADDILALYTKIEGGKEVIEHVRIRECAVVRDGYAEKLIERVRVFEPGIWELHEKDAEGTWSKVQNGTIARSGRHASVPLVLFYTGEREGELKVKPPLEDLAHMQIELYQALSRQDEILTFAGSPMLCAKGLKPPTEGKFEVGPKRILFAPPGIEGVQTGYEFIQPAAANIAEIRNHVTSIIDDMRRLGMQPMTPRSGGVTATGQSIEAAKAHSAVQAWAILLADALEQAWTFTCEWMGEAPNVEVDVNTDFAVQPFAQAPLEALDKARARRDISLTTYWDGLRRLDVLPPDFDAAKEAIKVADELKTIGASQERDPATGRKVDVTTNQPNPAPAPVV